MTDIVERLRYAAEWKADSALAVVINEAADEIERLRDELHRRTIERDYHLRMADKLADEINRLRQLEKT